MKKIFLDCGLYDGVAIRQYVFDDSWEIYSFEPNPDIDTKAVLAKTPKFKLFKKAVWIKGGKARFTRPERHDAAHIDLSGNVPDEDVIEVPTINFSKFVDKLDEADLVVCSMDIEGAEFEVLPKMLAEGTIDKLDILDVEFHHRLTKSHTNEEVAELIKQIEDRGVIVRLKVTLE